MVPRIVGNRSQNDESVRRSGERLPTSKGREILTNDEGEDRENERGSRIRCFHGDEYAATRVKFSLHDGFSRLDGRNNIVEDAVNSFFMKGSVIPEGKQVKLQRFAFETQLIGNIPDRNVSEIRLAGDGTK